MVNADLARRARSSVGLTRAFARRPNSKTVNIGARPGGGPVNER